MLLLTSLPCIHALDTAGSTLPFASTNDERAVQVTHALLTKPFQLTRDASSFLPIPPCQPANPVQVFSITTKAN